MEQCASEKLKEHIRGVTKQYGSDQSSRAPDVVRGNFDIQCVAIVKGVT
jgi:hypothetical protein